MNFKLILRIVSLVVKDSSFDRLENERSAVEFHLSQEVY